MYKVTAEQSFALFFGFKEKPLKYEIKKHGRPSNHYIFLITFFLGFMKKWMIVRNTVKKDAD